MSVTKWRLLIGPYHSQYPWYNHHENDAIDLAYATTLTSAMTAGSTANMALASAASFPTSGGVWVGPVNAGEGWEYVVYTGKSGNSLTGVARESSTVRDHNGAHGIGAQVMTWYPITSDDGTLTITEQIDDTYSVITWTASISGFLFPQHVMRNNHIAVVQTNTDNAGWRIALVGFVDSPSASGDHTNQSPWSVTIRTIDVLLQAKVKALRIGGLDLAKEGTATGSTPLVLAYDERASGDFTAAAPNFDAASTIDRNNKTLWIGERWMGHALTYPFPNADTVNDGAQKFNQVYCNPPPGTPSGSKFIELIQTNDHSPLDGIALNAADPTISDGNTRIWLLHSADTAEGDLIILCQDEAIYRQLNPLSTAKVVFENKDFFDCILPTGGELWLRLGQLNMWLAHMAWGDKNGGIHHSDRPGNWSGATIAAPGYDETLFYTHAATAPSTVAYWQVGKLRTGGYKINTHPDQYVAIELPGLGLKLTESITASSPASGQLLKISDSAGPSNSGLPASGRLQIGDEQMDYSAKVEGGVTLSGRGVNSTTAAIHDADDIVYLVSGGVPTDAHLLATAGWRRYGGTIYPSRFKLWRSILQSPRNPEEDNWEDDWVQVGSEVTGNIASSWDYTMSPSLRCRHLMLTMDLMTTDPARARLNEIVATIDNSAYDTSLWLINGTRAGAVIAQLVQNAGLNAATVVDIGNTSQLYDQTTADDIAWTVISDLAEFASCRLTVGRDSRITVADDDFWETGLESVTSTWAASNAAETQIANRNGIAVSQIQLKWRTPDSSSSGTENYPPNPNAFGAPQETQELIYPNSTAAQTAAKKRFILGRYPYEFTVMPTVPMSGTRPSEVHSITWDYNRTTIAVVRKAVLKTVEHKLSGGRWSETLHFVRIEREAEY